MTWFIDDVNLSTLAFNVQNRSAGWHVPAKRGENLVIPGRHGAQWLPNKPFEQGSLSLTMWAVGATEDGQLPTLIDSARQCRDNLDKLTALFGQSSRLLEVIQISSNAFGVQNLVTNPNFGGVTPSLTPSYQNLIVNPAFRRMITTTRVRNLFTDPNTVTNAAPLPTPDTYLAPTWTQNYENLALDPVNKYKREDAAVTSEINYAAPPSFESYASNDTLGAGFWTTAANTTATVQANSANDQTNNPNGGTFVFRILTTAGLALGASLGTRPLLSGSGFQWVYGFRYRRAQNTSTVRNFQMRANSYTTGGTLIANGAWKTFSVPSGSSTWASATYAMTVDGGLTPNSRITLDYKTNEAWVTGDGLIIDCVTLVSVDAALVGTPMENVACPFWDGGAAWPGTQFDSTPDRSISRWFNIVDSRWVASPPTSATTSAYLATSSIPASDQFGSTLGFIAFGSTTGGTQTFTSQVAAPTAGTPYTLRALCRGVTGGTYTMNLLKMGTSDPGYSVVSTFSFTGTGGTSQVTTQMTGTFNAYYGPTAYVAAPGDLFQVQVVIPVRTDGFHGFQYNFLAVTDVTGINGQGDATASGNTQYSWAGEGRNSKTIIKQRRGKHFPSIRNNLIASGTSPVVYYVEAPCRIDGEVNQAFTDNVALPTTHQGVFFSASVAGYLNSDAVLAGLPTVSAFARVETLDASGTVLSTHDGPSLATIVRNGPDGFQTISVTVPFASVPTLATQVRCTIRSVSALRGTGLVVNNWLVSPVAQVTAFFSGDDGRWEGAFNDSASVLEVSAPQYWNVFRGIVNVSDRLWVASVGANTGITVATSVGTQAAGTYLFGAEIGTYQSLYVPVVVKVELRNSGTLVGTYPAGTLSATSTELVTQIQGILTPASTFNEIRLLFDPGTEVKVSKVFLYAATANNPVQHLNFNQIQNPNFLAAVVGGSSTGPELCTNSGFDANTSGWAAYGAGTTLARVTFFLHTAPASMGVTMATGMAPGTAGCSYLASGLTVGRSYTFSVWLYTTSTEPKPYAYSAAAPGFYGPDMLLTNTWGKSTVTFTATATSHPLYVLNHGATTAARAFYVDDVSLVDTLELLTNPHLDAAITGWSTSAGTVPTLAFSSTIKRTGAGAMKVTWPTAVALASYASYTVPGLVIGSAYNLSAWVYVPAGSTAAAPAIRMGGLNGTPVTTADTWVQSTLTIIATATSQQLQFIATGAPTAAQVCYVDDVSVKRAGDVDQWVGTNMTPVATTKGTGISIGVNTSLAATQFQVTPGQVLTFDTWGYAGTTPLQPDVQFRTSSVMQPVGTELLTNTTFETTTSPWSGTVALALSSAYYHSGTKSMQCTLVTGGASASYAAFSVSLTAGVQYRWSIWILLNPGAASAVAYVNPGSFTGNVITTSGSWQQSTITFTATTTGTNTMYVVSQSASTAGQLWYLDDASLTVLTAEQHVLTTPITSTTMAYASQAVTVPPNQNWVQVVYANTGAGAGGTVAYSYLGLDTIDSEDAGDTQYADPYEFPYFDGDATKDYYGEPAQWAGTTNGSVSNVMPQIASGWVNDGVAGTVQVGGANGSPVRPLATYSPPETDGKMGWVVAIPIGTTKTYRTVGIPNAKAYISGQISVCAGEGVQVVVEVYQASSATATGGISAAITLTPNSGSIVKWKDITRTDAYVYVQIRYTENANRSGYPVRFDNLLLFTTINEIGNDAPGYFDGSTSGGAWDGNPDNSTSSYYGGGRRAYAEVNEAIDFTSMAGGTRAEFAVGMTIPSAFWEDLLLSTFRQTVIANDVVTSPGPPPVVVQGFTHVELDPITSAVLYNGAQVTLTPLKETTAPIDDALLSIVVTGTVNNLEITDVASGAYLVITGTLPVTVVGMGTDNTIYIDNQGFTVTTGLASSTNAVSLITRVVRGGSNQLLPITPSSNSVAPQLRFRATGTGSIAITVIARRRYFLA